MAENPTATIHPARPEAAGEISSPRHLGSGKVFENEESVGMAGNLGSLSKAGDQAQQSMLRDIDSILARLETGIQAERIAMDALLARLTGKAA